MRLTVPMTQFEFLSVFISIVLAFSVSDILSHWGEEIRLRGEIRHYWVHSAWSLLLLIVMVQIWWALWLLRDRPAWTFAEYLGLLLPYLLVALLAYVVTPPFGDGERNIKRYYYDNSPWIFSIAAAYGASWMLFATVISGELFFEPNSVMRLVALLLMVALAAWKNEHFHAVGVVSTYVLLAYWIAMTVFTL